jgi:hypothetical protein
MAWKISLAFAQVIKALFRLKTPLIVPLKMPPGGYKDHIRNSLIFFDKFWGWQVTRP